jgi:hypothetical protein
LEEDVQIVRGSFTFSSNGAAQDAVNVHNVGTTVTAATAVLEGMDVEFANRQDHHLGRLRVILTTDIVGAAGDTVNVNAGFAMRDWSGGPPGSVLDGDDAINGTFFYSLIVF